MSNWSLLKNAVVGVIKENNNKGITGNILQNTLLNIISSLGENFMFVGIANKSTNPGMPDGNVFYISSESGVYSNFSGIEILENELAVLYISNNVWKKSVVNASTKEYSFLVKGENLIMPNSSKLLTNSIADASYKVTRGKTEDVVEVKGDWFLIFSSQRAVNSTYSSTVKYKLRPGTYTIKSGAALAIKISSMESLADSEYVDMTSISIIPNPKTNSENLLMYGKYNDLSFGLLHDAIMQKDKNYVMVEIKSKATKSEVNELSSKFDKIASEGINTKYNFNPSEDNGYWYGDPGGKLRIVSNAGFKYNKEIIDCKPGDTVRITGFNPLVGSVYCVTADEGNNFIKRINFTNLSGTEEFVVPIGTSKLGFSFIVGNDNFPITSAKMAIGDLSISLNAVKNNNLKDKKFTSFGDSITYQEKWQPFLIPYFSLIHTNCGIGSTCLAGSTRPNSFWTEPRLTAVKNSGPYIITIMGGANDHATNITIGTDEDIKNKNVNTFLGAYAYIIEDLLTWKPSLKIILMATSWGWDDGRGLWVENGGNVTTGLLYTDFANATKKIGQLYGLPVVDLHGEMMVNKFTKSIYLSDEVHPNTNGGRVMASLIKQKIEAVTDFNI